MQLIKGLLIIVAMFIAAAVGFIGNELYHRTHGNAPMAIALPHLTGPAAAPTEDNNAPPVSTQLTLPEGAKISTLSAANDRVVFEATLPEGGYQLYIVDPKRAAITGIITFDSTIRKEPGATPYVPAQ